MKYKISLLHIKDLNHDVKQLRFTKPEGYTFVSGHSAIVSINKQGLENSRIPLTFISTNDKPYLEFIVKKYHEKITEKFHDLAVGDEIIIWGMFGSVRYVSAGLFIAGGIGIAPPLAILRQLHKNNLIDDNFLIYSCKTKADVLYEEELKEMLGNNIIITLTQEKNDSYSHGRINEDMLKKFSTKREIYVTGPEEFIQDIREKIVHKKDI